MMRFRGIVGLALLWALGGCAGGEHENGPRYNVVLVTLDTTRADRFGCYGYDKDTTPHFDLLAADGVRFDMAAASASVTPVSHASILTGLNQYRHGLRVLHAASAYRLEPEIPTLTTILKDHGWTNGAFLSAFTVSEYYGFDHGFDRFDNGIDTPVDEVLQPDGDGRYRWQVQKNQQRSDVTTDRAIEWLTGAREPFFLWVHYWDPHDAAIKPPNGVLNKFGYHGSVGDDRMRALYDAEVQFVDSQFGRLVAELKAGGLYENTILVVTSDHGEGLGDHDWWGHRILYQEQIRVPLIFRLPAGPTGLSVSSLARTIDIVPTVLDWLDLEPQGRMEGRSLHPLLDGKPDEPRIAYADQLNLFDTNAGLLERRPQADLLHSATDGRWKLIHRPRHPGWSELYDLEADPGETTNLYESEPAEAKRLMKFLEDSGGFVARPFGESADAQARERLKALGYVN